MNLSKEELVKYVRIQTYGMIHVDRDVEGDLCKIRFAIWNSVLGMKGRKWNCSRYRNRMAGTKDEEILEMIARARLEEEI